MPDPLRSRHRKPFDLMSCMPEFPNDLPGFLKFVADHAPWRERGCRYAKRGCVMRKVAVEYSDRSRDWTVMLNMLEGNISIHFQRAYFDSVTPCALIAADKESLQQICKALTSKEPPASESLKEFQNLMGGNHGLSDTTAQSLFDSQNGLCDFVRPINRAPVALAEKEITKPDPNQAEDPLIRCIKKNQDFMSGYSWFALKTRPTPEKKAPVRRKRKALAKTSQS